MRPSSATAILRSVDAGARLRERREDLHLTQKQVAEKVGVSKRGYLAWERGESGITWPNVLRLAEVLECSEDWLMTGGAIEDLPEAEAGQILGLLHGLDARLERIEAALVEGGLMGTADGDELVDATRQAKAALAAGLDAEDAAQATPAEPGTPREDDATPGSARARREGTPRSAAKRAR